MTHLRLLHANDSFGEHAASWYNATCDTPDYPTLLGRIDADVCIIGAGYTGLSTALGLAESGAKVVVLEAHRVGWGASGRNGGQLGSGFNTDIEGLEKHYGQQTAKALWQLSEDAKTTVHHLAAKHAFQIDYQPGIIHATHRSRYVQAIHDDAHYKRDVMGYPDIEPLNKDQLHALCRSPDYAGGALDKGAGHLHPLKLATGLAGAAARAGAQLFERSEALRITTQSTSEHRITTAQGVIYARQLVLAGNGYLDRFSPRTQRAVMPINNFIVATEPLGHRALDLLPKRHAVADSRFVVNYFRLSQDNRLLFGGGETYRYQFPDNPEHLVRRAMKTVFPDLENVRIDYAWGGTLAITRSRLPFVRRLDATRYAAGGYSGHGVGLAVQTGQAIAAAICSDSSHFDQLARFPEQPFPGGNPTRGALLAISMTIARWLDRW